MANADMTKCSNKFNINVSLNAINLSSNVKLRLLSKIGCNAIPAAQTAKFVKQSALWRRYQEI